MVWRGVAMDGRKVLQRSEVLQWMGGCNKWERWVGVATDGWRGVATVWRGVATVWRGVAMDGQKVLQRMVEEVLQWSEVLQWMVGRCCNKQERWDGKDATGHCNISQWMDYRE